MNKIKNSSMFFLWAGAAISITEIYTGGIIAPLGIIKGISAILIGHIIGTLFLAFGGYISFKGKKNAMDKVKDSFGGYGTKVVSILNVLQLVAWSAIMIIQGARVVSAQIKIPLSISIFAVGIIVFLWSFWFNNYTKKVNDISVIILIVICILMFLGIHRGTGNIKIGGSVSFTTAIEMAIAMPVSWLPLIGDYSKDGKSGKGVFLSSFFGYFIGSILMYALGLYITVFTGMDIIQFLSSKGIIASLIVLLATVTTTFVDICSAAISSKQIYNYKDENRVTFVFCLISILIAFVFPMENYQNFLLIIGSVFVPVYTVVIIDYILKRTCKLNINFIAAFSAIFGVIAYNYFTNNNLGIPTVFTFLSVMIVYYIGTLLQSKIGKYSFKI
ncbi:putative hydroxymethylpyrimidine transporter CytX [Clostridium akagii]|uniref:putative hydroxymethylpyrimidine transporter CytX n=1 Tax=Clostridium akagii TaxID=91623 RepID=UPI0005676762|nr:putative hydroxymethylpyrimidine transporter CytX [Clostridium akagii]